MRPEPMRRTRCAVTVAARRQAAPVVDKRNQRQHRAQAEPGRRRRKQRAGQGDCADHGESARARHGRAMQRTVVGQIFGQAHCCVQHKQQGEADGRHALTARMSLLASQTLQLAVMAEAPPSVALAENRAVPAPSRSAPCACATSRAGKGAHAERELLYVTASNRRPVSPRQWRR